MHDVYFQELPIFLANECRLGMPYTSKRDLGLHPNLKEAMLSHHFKHYIGEKISVVVATPPDVDYTKWIVDFLEGGFRQGEVGD